jgi:CRISPR-associated endonuclease Csn1
MENEYHRQKGAKPDDAVVPRPWEGIRTDAERAVAEIVVSHRVRKKVSGPLHKETTYGDTGIDEKTKTGTYRLFVTRKPVERLSKSEIEEIVDDRVRLIVRDWVAARGGDPKKAFASFPRVSEGGAEIRKVRLRSKQQLALMAGVSTGYADMGNNHHVAIYRLPSGKADFEVVSLFEASRRLMWREPVVLRRRDDNATFVMSLSVGDTIKFAKDAGQPLKMWRVQKIASKGQVSLLDLTDASPQEPSLFEPMVGGIISRDAVKLSVDPIGRVRPAND